jgi:GTP-binding protein
MAIRPLVAIVGRPNVGKSTLFNKLVGARVALVEDVPGVTRDRHYGDGDWDGRALSFVDTGGFVPEGASGAVEPGRKEEERRKTVGGGVGGRIASIMDDKALLASIRAQAQLAIEEAQAIILVCDAEQGLVPSDEEVARLLHRSGKPLFIAANKVDSERREQELPIADFYSLGIERVYPVSAEHSRGLSDLLDDLVAALPNAPKINDEPEQPPDDGRIRMAVVGRPNVGKSTLLNALLGEERFIASPVPGTTHDPVDEEFEYKGHTFILTDTAGIRRSKSISAKVESFSVIRALNALEQADVAAVLVDPSELAVDQDARIAGIALEKGRGIVIVVNKWDTVENDPEAQKKAKETIETELDFIPWAPVVFVSALERLKINKVLDEAIALHRQATTRIGTPELNKWLQDVQESNPAPLWRGFPVKFFFASQIGTRPVSIAISTNRPQAVSDSYRRYMMNRLRERFGLEVPVRLSFRQKSGDKRTRPAPEKPGKRKGNRPVKSTRPPKGVKSEQKRRR